MKLLLALLAIPLFGQQTNPPPACQQVNCYTASTGNVSLTSAATAATIQQPATAPYQQVYGIKAVVQCSVACTVTRSKDGSAASATAGTVVQSPAQPGGRVAPLMLFFAASNASGGTTIDVTNVQAGVMQVFDLSDVVFGSVPNQTYTVAVGAVTGTVNISFYVGLK